jgi:hypothetical protein
VHGSASVRSPVDLNAGLLCRLPVWSVRERTALKMSTLRACLVVVFLTCTVLGTSGLVERVALVVISLTGTITAALLIYLSYRKRQVDAIDATLMSHEPQDRSDSTEAIDRE